MTTPVIDDRAMCFRFAVDSVCVHRIAPADVPG
jgi:hypothetical protein